MKAPFIYFGGKSRCASLIWERLGDVPNYVEPFFGSGAVLLARPDTKKRRLETANDSCGFICNFYRAIRLDPNTTAYWADREVNELDLHAIHKWLVDRASDMTEKLRNDPDYFDAKIAGRWVHGLCCWIGSGWCEGQKQHIPVMSGSGKGINTAKMSEQVPYLSGTGCGMDTAALSQKMPRLGDSGVDSNAASVGNGTSKRLPHLGDNGRGIHALTIETNSNPTYRKRPRLHHIGKGVNAGTLNGELTDSLLPVTEGIYAWFRELSHRLQHVRVCCGDWSRVMGESVTVKNGLTGVFLDPPYADTAGRSSNLYRHDSVSVAHEVREWAIANGDNPQLRICLAGYVDEHEMPADWECVAWKAHGGYSNRAGSEHAENKHKERLWFNKSCLTPGLFGREL